MKSLLAGLGFLALLGLCPAAATAATWEAAGLTFSDELGGFKLVSVSGSGSLADPIVIVEELATLEAAVLVIRGRQKRKQSERQVTIPTFINLAIIKIVINASGRVWTGFDLELQETYRRPSTYGDGLSFDQMRSFGETPPGSDVFAFTQQISEPYDRVSFGRGSVDPGSTVRFNFFITDPTPRGEFFLVQEPKLLLSRKDVPGHQLATIPLR